MDSTVLLLLICDETEYTGTDVLFEFEFLGAQMYYQANVHIHNC